MANRSEEREQARLVRWSHKPSVRALMPQLAYLHHSPNGGKRDAFTGAQMTALGVKRGFPDLILPAPSSTGAYSGLAIEMKSATGQLSPEQRTWLTHFSAQHWDITIARSADAAREAICRHFGLDPTQVDPLPPS